MPFYVGDYLADTNHLSTEQHGAYVLLILHYWRTGKPLPLDPAQLARIARLSLAKWKKSAQILEAFFEKTDAGFRQKRVEDEMAQAIEKYNKRAEAGRRGGQAKAKQKSSNATPPLNQPQSQPHEVSKDTSPRRAKRRATRAPEDWWPSVSTIKAIAGSLTSDQLDAEVARYRDWSRSSPKGAKLDHDAAFRNWVRNDQYRKPAEKESSAMRSIRALRDA